MTKQIYIMGRGHSGSTILDTIIGGASQGFSMGELLSGFFTKEPVCSCGENIDSCLLWSAVRRKFNVKCDNNWDRLKKLSIKYGTIKQFPNILFNHKVKQDLKELASLSCQFNEIVLEESSASFTVDSSKEVTRGYFYSCYVKNVKIIFIVRNGEQILASYWWRLNNGEEFKFLRKRYKPKYFYFPYMLVATLGWIFGNIIAEIISIGKKDTILRVRYEDITSNPIGIIHDISKFINIPLDDVNEKILSNDGFLVNHVIAGNRIRMQGEVKFKKNGSERYLPLRYKILFKILAFPMLIKYGYLG